MRRIAPVFLALLLALLLLWGCSGGLQLPLRQEIAWGDRQREWALVYYQSWRREKEPTYLRMARQHMSSAILTYYQLQVRMGHSYPDFYQVDTLRRSSCDFLNELDRLGLRHQVAFDDGSRTGCLTPD
ncbi:MAG: hypothetical protein OEW39_04225 [Deltaproteobacteria bacterium]|nr:hypothetical protein [Deltaproteobacteria bacterium]